VGLPELASRVADSEKDLAADGLLMAMLMAC